ncbi:NAD(P)/FAD-dependent oxidoreductase [Actinokineospora globicatena]|uniref:NAD(P)/FAD-dependent oxidoreductase n=1 Tax=Actinokineospora globicatena TaxID=103729 RepID=UPI0020A41B17|nr:NAD(P)/FAD-dependent oxidoreductase [Actinokineospora globicatena]GLW80116.1 thioredoxin reductase [Actinokineospora globicatena]GLW86945.1 thioredoxin reductase [Actinokineospora globicatena]
MTTNTSEHEYDTVVIGAGAAGLNAALLLARARRRVAVVDSGRPRNAPAAHMHGFLSRDGIAPSAFLEVGRTEVLGYGASVVAAVVDTVVANDGGGFTAVLDTGVALRTRSVVVATGLRDELPEVPGVRERWGRDVVHCPYCHGYEVRDRPIGVLGTSPGAVFHAQMLRQWSADVVLFAHTLALSPQEQDQLHARGIEVVAGAISSVAVVDDAVRGVELADGTVVARSAVFVVPRMVPNDSVLTGLGCAVGADGWVSVDKAGQTSVPGVFAAGNVIDPRAQVVTAAGMGSAAGFAINIDLVQRDIADAVTARAHAG